VLEPGFANTRVGLTGSPVITFDSPIFIPLLRHLCRSLFFDRLFFVRLRGRASQHRLVSQLALGFADMGPTPLLRSQVYDDLVASSSKSSGPRPLKVSKH
jgi:hypothetical protein